MRGKVGLTRISGKLPSVLTNRVEVNQQKGSPWHVKELALPDLGRLCWAGLAANLHTYFCYLD
ncbi:hypothetical protein TSUD_264500 [Trifolium subterraneum]|uniref:Uncharacterized protein n=1 Tax=Trifolium subterraneum TaxID=3900 RepID=A0A2Z6MAQ6_TRISU|nr:hypothetical protein TSUD_264500 [Trifolium subterraneum]